MNNEKKRMQLLLFVSCGDGRDAFYSMLAAARVGTQPLCYHLNVSVQFDAIFVSAGQWQDHPAMKKKGPIYVFKLGSLTI
jgi:hypothetical protein